MNILLDSILDDAQWKCEQIQQLMEREYMEASSWVRGEIFEAYQWATNIMVEELSELHNQIRLLKEIKS